MVFTGQLFRFKMRQHFQIPFIHQLLILVLCGTMCVCVSDILVFFLFFIKWQTMQCQILLTSPFPHRPTFSVNNISETVVFFVSLPIQFPPFNYVLCIRRARAYCMMEFIHAFLVCLFFRFKEICEKIKFIYGTKWSTVKPMHDYFYATR